MYELVYVATNLFFTYTIYKFMRVFFERLKVSRAIEFLAYTVYFVVITAAYLIVDIPLLTLICNILLLFTVTFCYETAMKQRVIAVFLIYVTLMVVESMIVYLSSSTLLSLVMSSNYQSTLGLLLTRIIAFAVVKIISCFKSIKSGGKIPVSYWFCILLIPISSLTLLVMFVGFTGISHTEAFILTILLLTINFVVFYLYDAVSENAHNLLQKSLLERQNQYYAQEFELIKGSMLSTNTLKHDLKNHLSSVCSLVRSGDNVAALAHIAQMQEVCSPTKKYANSSNLAVDSIINFKLAEVEKYDIEVLLDLSIPRELAIPSFDLTVILGNLIDNAIDANKTITDEKYIHISVKCDKGRMLIRVENPYLGKLKTEGKKYLTTKRQSEGHGLGIESVRNVVNKYNGVMSTENENNIFAVQILIYLE